MPTQNRRAGAKSRRVCREYQLGGCARGRCPNGFRHPKEICLAGAHCISGLLCSDSHHDFTYLQQIALKNGLGPFQMHRRLILRCLSDILSILPVVLLPIVVDYVPTSPILRLDAKDSRECPSCADCGFKRYVVDQKDLTHHCLPFPREIAYSPPWYHVFVIKPVCFYSNRMTIGLACTACLFYGGITTHESDCQVEDCVECRQRYQYGLTPISWVCESWSGFGWRGTGRAPWLWAGNIICPFVKYQGCYEQMWFTILSGLLPDHFPPQPYTTNLKDAFLPLNDIHSNLLAAIRSAHS